MKDDVYIIGYYKLPENFTSTVYIENTKTYKKEIYNVLPENVDATIKELKEKYPNSSVCEFVY